MNITPKPDESNELNIQFQREVISDRNNKFLVCFKADSYSELIITAKSDDIVINYINTFSVEYLKNNRYFFLFDDLKEICEEISNIIKEGKIIIYEEIYSIIISILLPTTTIKDIKFELKGDKRNDKILNIQKDKINYKINNNEKINDNDKLNDKIK